MTLVDLLDSDVAPGILVRWRHGDAFYAVSAVSDDKITLRGKDAAETVLSRAWLLKDFVRVDFGVPAGVAEHIAIVNTEYK